MKLNEKGFTLVEILATVAIIAVLSGVAISAVTRYQDQAREDSYAAMETTAYSAAQSYIQKHSSVIPAPTSITEDSLQTAVDTYMNDRTKSKKIEVSTLVDEGYMDEPQDPATRGNKCSGAVYVSKTKGTGGAIDTYTYLVQIDCAKYNSTHKAVTNVGADGKRGTADDTTVTVTGVIFES